MYKCLDINILETLIRVKGSTWLDFAREDPTTDKGES